jgi:hypothetical protein
MLIFFLLGPLGFRCNVSPRRFEVYLALLKESVHSIFFFFLFRIVIILFRALL